MGDKMSYASTNVQPHHDGLSCFEVSVTGAESVNAAKAEAERIMNERAQGKPHKITAELFADKPDNRAYIRFYAPTPIDG